jgi:hypothetical protein
MAEAAWTDADVKRRSNPSISKPIYARSTNDAKRGCLIHGMVCVWHPDGSMISLLAEVAKMLDFRIVAKL